jgi:hypothetical protein
MRLTSVMHYTQAIRHMIKVILYTVPKIPAVSMLDV